jgi:PAS domain S-box-containing protein
MATRKKASQAKAVQKKQAKKSLSPRKTTKPTQKKSTKTPAKLPRGSKPSRTRTKSRTAEVARPTPQPGFPIVGIGASASGLKAKQALEASERQQRTLAQINAIALNALPAHIALLDANGVILSVNEAWKRFATANVLKGANYGIGCNYITVCEQAHGDCAEEGQAVADGLRAVLAGTQKSFALEYPCHAPNEERWFRVMITPISETENAGAVVMHLNVTERRRVEETLEKEKQFIATILDTVGALVVALDPEWRIVRFNRVCENLTGRNIEEMRGKSFLDLAVVSGEDAQEVKDLLASFKEKQFPAFFESAWLDRERQLRWISWSNTVIRDKQRKIENIIATGIDITERKKAEQSLQTSEDRLNEAQRIAHVGSWELNLLTNVLHWSDEIYRIFEVDPMQHTPSYGLFLEAIHPEDRVLVDKAYNESVKKKTSYEIVHRLLMPDGRIKFVQERCKTFFDHNGNALRSLGTVQDITLRKIFEKKLKNREEELQALGGKLISAQEDERRRISRELHDDMNQRLAVLALNIQSAQKKKGTLPLMDQTLQKLYDGVSSLSDDVRHLAYQLHPSILDDLGLEVTLRSFVDDFSKWEGIPVTFTATDMTVALPQELASCLYRVAQESMRNVSKHAQATQVDVRLIGVDGGVRLSIQDNGKGFGMKKMKSDKYGLGLIGMQERVRVVQGTFEVKSAPGQGTEITVWVPIKEAGSS